MARTILDGYNLAFRDEEPGAVPLEELRALFLLRVDAARLPGSEVIVVFDGRPGPRRSPGTAEGLTVRYSRSPRTADDLIVSLVKREARGRTTVLTHDRDLGRRVREAGGQVGDPAAFFRRPRRKNDSDRRRAEKPRAPKGAEIDEWERLIGDRGDDD